MGVEDWAVGDMIKWVPSFVCGAVLDGVTEFSANCKYCSSKKTEPSGGTVEGTISYNLVIYHFVVADFATCLSFLKSH
jgi:hypothetical protein